MNTLNTNLSSLLSQLNNVSSPNSIENLIHSSSKNRLNQFNNDPACFVAPEMANIMNGFDFSFDNFANFKDLIGTAQDSYSKIKNEGEDLISLINKAKEGDLSDELLSQIQDEVNNRIARIEEIKNGSEFNGVNPLAQSISLNISNWQNLFGVSNEVQDDGENEVSDVLASISFDMTIDASDGNKSFSIGASATIEIGVADDGSLLINVNAAMDFDLSGISADKDNADKSLQLLQEFINFITGKQNDLNTASNIVDSLFAKATASIEGDNFSILADNNVNIEQSSSDAIKGQIVQNATIKLDGSANMSPNIAINIL